MIFFGYWQGPTLSCLEQNKVEFPIQLLVWHNNKPSGQVKIKAGDVREFFWRREEWGKVERGNVKKVEEGRWRLSKEICCYGKIVADLGILLFTPTKQDRVGPTLQSRNNLFTSAACCTGFTIKLDLYTREITYGYRCYYPHTSIDEWSHVCGIFSVIIFS